MLRSPGFARAARHADGIRSRLILAGFGETNTQLIVHAVQNFFAIPGHRLCATAFDEGERKLPALEARFPELIRLADIDFVGCTFNTGDPAAWGLVDQTLRGIPEDPSALVVVVALADDALSLHTRSGSASAWIASAPWVRRSLCGCAKRAGWGGSWPRLAAPTYSPPG